MKKILFLLILIPMFSSCEQDFDSIDYEQIELQAFIIENYSEDAKQLYFNEIMRNNSHPK